MSIINVHNATLLYPGVQDAAREPPGKSEEDQTILANVKKTKTKEKYRLIAEQAIQRLRSKVEAAEVEIVHAAEALAEAAKSKAAKSEKAKPTDKTGLTAKENKEFGDAHSDRITGHRKRKAHKAYKVRRAQSVERFRAEEREKAEEMNREDGNKAFEMVADDKDVESSEDIGIFGRHVTVTAEAVSSMHATIFASK